MQMVAAHAAAKGIKARRIGPRAMPLPLHPGAEKYYREAGGLICDVGLLPLPGISRLRGSPPPPPPPPPPKMLGYGQSPAGRFLLFSF